MKWLLLSCCISVLASGQQNSTKDIKNVLTKAEAKQGWVLLFDGVDSKGWRGAYSDDFPAKGWQIKEGELIVLGSNGSESANGGDIVTLEQYSSFDLKVDFKITPGANSGIKYFVTLSEGNHKGSAYGFEYQILDDDLHPDAKLGSHEGSRTVASLYDLIKAQNKKASPVGEWNHAEIVVKGNHVEHWLNGIKVLEFEKGSEQIKKLIEESKYKTYPNFGQASKGHILLQDHGNEVHFCNIKIKVL